VWRAFVISGSGDELMYDDVFGGSGDELMYDDVFGGSGAELVFDANVPLVRVNDSLADEPAVGVGGEPVPLDGVTPSDY